MKVQMPKLKRFLVFELWILGIGICLVQHIIYVLDSASDLGYGVLTGSKDPVLPILADIKSFVKAG